MFTLKLITFFACPPLFWTGFVINVIGDMVAAAIGPERMAKVAERLCRI